MLIADAATVFNEAKHLFEKVKAVPHDLRGVGIQLTKLERIPPVNTALKRFLVQGAVNKTMEFDTKYITRKLPAKKWQTDGKKVAMNCLTNYFKSTLNESKQVSTLTCFADD